MFASADLLGDRLDSARRAWQDVIAPTLPGRTARRVAALASSLFEEATDDIRGAALELERAGRRHDPATIRITCRTALRTLFG